MLKLSPDDTMILERYPSINYAVVYRPHAVQKFAAVWHPQVEGEAIWWSQGHYFDTLRDCMKYIETLL